MCMFSVFVHHMHADVHASVCICMWMSGCLPRSIVTILKFTYLSLTFFFCVPFHMQWSENNLGDSVLAFHSVCFGDQLRWRGLPTSDFFSLSLIVLGLGLSLSLELTK